MLEETLLVYDDNYFEPPWSHASVFALDATFLLVLVICAREILRARRREAEAANVAAPSAEPFDGARFVAGNVELAQGEEAAVRVTVTQSGTQTRTKNGYTHKWEETHRETLARPFYLRLESGARIRVEPPKDVLLVDSLDQREWIQPLERRVRAELRAGEHAIVEGVLRRSEDPEEMASGKGYRQAAHPGWVMKPGPRGMQISTEDLSRRHALRARAFKWTIFWVVIAGIFMQIPLFEYRRSFANGRSFVAEYLNKSSYTSRGSKGKITVHSLVHVAYQDERGVAQRRSIEVDEADWTELPLGPGTIWMRHRPGDVAALGKGASILSVYWLFAAGLLGLGIYRVGSTFLYRRWYEGRLKDKGQGPLPPPTGQRFS